MPGKGKRRRVDSEDPEWNEESVISAIAPTRKNPQRECNKPLNKRTNNFVPVPVEKIQRQNNFWSPEKPLTRSLSAPPPPLPVTIPFYKFWDPLPVDPNKPRRYEIVPIEITSDDDDDEEEEEENREKTAEELSEERRREVFRKAWEMFEGMKEENGWDDSKFVEFWKQVKTEKGIDSAGEGIDSAGEGIDNAAASGSGSVNAEASGSGTTANDVEMNESISISDDEEDPKELESIRRRRARSNSVVVHHFLDQEELEKMESSPPPPSQESQPLRAQAFVGLPQFVNRR